MKKDYNKTKKVAILVLTLVAVCLATGVGMYLLRMGQAVPAVTEETEAVTESTEVTVPEISVPEDTQKVEDTGAAETEQPEAETQSAEENTITSGQDNTTKEEAQPPAEKPVVTDSEAVNQSEQQPQYEAEVTQPQTQPEQPAGGSANEEGKVYVPGFGYVDPPGQAQGTQAESDGDWNKQIGDMN